MFLQTDDWKRLLLTVALKQMHHLTAVLRPMHCQTACLKQMYHPIDALKLTPDYYCNYR